MPTRALHAGRGRAARAAAKVAPRPKVAAGLLAAAVLQLLARLGVDVGVLGIDQHTAEALIVFGIMWAWRDPFAVPLADVPLGATQLPGAGGGEEVHVVLADRTQAKIARDRVLAQPATVDSTAIVEAIDAGLGER